MKDTILIVIIATTLSFFVTEANAACKVTEFNGIVNASCGADLVTPRITLPGIYIGDIIIPSQPKKKVVRQEQPSAQYLEVLAQAEARAKDATRQWWIDFFNNNK